MKKVLYIIALFFSFATIAQEHKVNWMTVEEAMEAQKKEPRKIIIDMYTTWCGPCKMLDKYTFKNEDVAKYINDNYYAVKFNAEGDRNVNFKGNTFKNPNYDGSRRGRNSQHEFAASFGVQSYPSILFLDEEGKFLLPVKGFHKPKQLEIFLKIFATNDYKKVTTKQQWESYQKNFKSEFKG